MASVRKRGKQGAYTALWRDGKGVLRERATKTTDRKRAEKLAAEWERTSRPEAGERTSERMRQVMTELHRELLGREMLHITVRDAATQWVDTRKGEVSGSSAYIYEHSLTELVEFLGPRADSHLYTLAREDLIKFRNAVGSRRSASTANHRIRVIRMWLKAMKGDHWISDNVAEGIKPLKKNERDLKNTGKRRPFSLAELHKVLLTLEEKIRSAALDEKEKARLLEWRAMIVRGYYTGQRLGDIARMTVGDEDPHLGQVNMITHKTSKRVIVEMHPAYIDFVLEQKTSDDASAPLHPVAHELVMRKGRVVTLSEQFAELLIAAGLRVFKAGTADEKTRYPLSYHSFRHSFVSHLQDAGVSRSVVQDMVGHDSAVVNAGYTKLDRKTKREAVAKLPNIMQLLTPAPPDSESCRTDSAH